MKKVLIMALCILLFMATDSMAQYKYRAYGGSSTVTDADSDGAADLANYMKSVLTTGKISITGPAAGSTRAKTVRDADDTIIELGGTYTPTFTMDLTGATFSNYPWQLSDSALTTLSSKVFSKTALTGAGGLDTVAYADLADGDIGYVGTIAGVWYAFVFEASSATAESSPNVITPDDTTGNGRWLLKLYCDGATCTVPQATTGAYSTLLEGSANGTNFRKWSVPDTLAADLNLRHANAVPTVNQFQMYPAPTDGVSQYTWTTYGSSLTPVIGDADDFDDNFTGANLFGGTYGVSAAGSVLLANATVGNNFTIVLEAAAATVIEPLATGTDDTIVLNGTALTQGQAITSSTAGAMCIFQYRAADSWMATCNGFTAVP